MFALIWKDCSGLVFKLRLKFTYKEMHRSYMYNCLYLDGCTYMPTTSDPARNHPGNPPLFPPTISPPPIGNNCFDLYHQNLFGLFRRFYKCSQSYRTFLSACAQPLRSARLCDSSSLLCVSAVFSCCGRSVSMIWLQTAHPLPC